MSQKTNLAQSIKINQSLNIVLCSQLNLGLLPLSKLLVKLVFQTMTVLVLIGNLSACAIFTPIQSVEPVSGLPEATPPVKEVYISSEPLMNLSKKDIIDAQNALNELGYEIGYADGIWGPRSAKAIRKFEQANGLDSARGHLSELNLNALGKETKITRKDQAAQITLNQYPFSARVDSSAPLGGAPQLVIIERARALLAKPNPYSEVVSQLARGTGVYVIRLQQGWYEVESENQIKGYLKAN